MLNWKLILKAFLILLLQVSLIEYAFGSNIEAEGATSTFRSDKRIEEFRRTDNPFTDIPLIIVLPGQIFQLVYEEEAAELLEMENLILKSLAVVSYNSERSPPILFS